MEIDEDLGPWGLLFCGLLFMIGVPYLYIAGSEAANYAWWLHGIFGIAFLWGVYSTLKGAGWLLYRWTGQDDDIAKYEAGTWGCWGLALLAIASLVLFNWEATSERFAALDTGTTWVFIAIFLLGYIQVSAVKNVELKLDKIHERLTAIEEKIGRKRRSRD